MPPKPSRASTSLPEHLEKLLQLFEVQDKMDRMGAIRAVEKEFDVRIDLETLLEEHEAFADRYHAWRDRQLKRTLLSLEDASINDALDGKRSPAQVLRAHGRMGNRSASDGGIMLDRSHRARIDEARRKGKW